MGGLDLNDLLWIHNNLIEAFNEIKGIHSKSSRWIDGEVYTLLRTKVHGPNPPGETVKNLFRGKMKFFRTAIDFHHRETKRVLVDMYNKIRDNALEAIPDPLDELEQSLISIQAFAKKAEEISEESAKLRQRLDGIRSLLNDNNPIEEEEHERQ